MTSSHTMWNTRSVSSRARCLVEKEMLAVLFGLIVHKHLSKVPRRLQAMLLRTHEYHFTVTYMTGTKILVDDALSRAPVSEAPTTELVIVNNLSLSLIVPNRLDEIEGTSTRYETMRLLGDREMLYNWKVLHLPVTIRLVVRVAKWCSKL